MSDKILVTGGAGYLGSILCERLLAAGHRVTVVDSFMFGQATLLHLCANPALEIIRGDVRDTALMRKVIADHDVIIPLAALVGAPLCDRDPHAATAVNFEAIREINRMRSAHQLIVYPTTNSGYGTKSGAQHCTEETPLEPISLYGRTVFGLSPRMRLDLLVNHFVHAAVTDGYIVIFEKDFKRNYIHIRDVADCFVHCLEHRSAMVGRPYNAGLDDANLSKEELALKVKEHVPNFYLHFSEVGSDPDKRNYIVSNQRLREAGFQARRSLDDGIRELLKGYKMIRKNQYGNV